MEKLLGCAGEGETQRIWVQLLWQRYCEGGVTGHAVVMSALLHATLDGSCKVISHPWFRQKAGAPCTSY